MTTLPKLNVIVAAIRDWQASRCSWPEAMRRADVTREIEDQLHRRIYRTMNEAWVAKIVFELVGESR